MDKLDFSKMDVNMGMFFNAELTQKITQSDVFCTDYVPNNTNEHKMYHAKKLIINNKKVTLQLNKDGKIKIGINNNLKTFNPNNTLEIMEHFQKGFIRKSNMEKIAKLISMLYFLQNVKLWKIKFEYKSISYRVYKIKTEMDKGRFVEFFGKSEDSVKKSFLNFINKVVEKEINFFKSFKINLGETEINFKLEQNGKLVNGFSNLYIPFKRIDFSDIDVKTISKELITINVPFDEFILPMRRGKQTTSKIVHPTTQNWLI